MQLVGSSLFDCKATAFLNFWMRGTYRCHEATHQKIRIAAQIYLSSVTERTLQVAFAGKVQGRIASLSSITDMF